MQYGMVLENTFLIAFAWTLNRITIITWLCQRGGIWCKTLFLGEELQWPFNMKGGLSKQSIAFFIECNSCTALVCTTSILTHELVSPLGKKIQFMFYFLQHSLIHAEWNWSRGSSNSPLMV